MSIRGALECSQISPREKLESRQARTPETETQSHSAQSQTLRKVKLFAKSSCEQSQTLRKVACRNVIQHKVIQQVCRRDKGTIPLRTHQSRSPMNFGASLRRPPVTGLSAKGSAKAEEAGATTLVEITSSPIGAVRAPSDAFRPQMPRRHLAMRRGVASMCRHPWALCSPRHILAWKAKHACAAKSNWSRTASRQTECDCERSWQNQSWLNLTHTDGKTSEVDSKGFTSDVPRDVS